LVKRTGAKIPLLLCPNDNNQMLKVERSSVEIDICPTCNGVWLDRGELNKLLAAEKEEASQSAEAQDRFQEEVQSFGRNPDEWKKSHKYDQDKRRYRYDGDDDDDDHHGSRGRKRRFSLLDLFD